ncbi:MAG: diacylglycerol kinase, partial [Gaiellaceae bacterium]
MDSLVRRCHTTATPYAAAAVRERARRLSRYGWRPADPPERPVLFVNQASGGGKAARAGLADRARERGIGVTVLRPDRSLESLVGEAVEG